MVDGTILSIRSVGQYTICSDGWMDGFMVLRNSCPYPILYALYSSVHWPTYTLNDFVVLGFHYGSIINVGHTISHGHSYRYTYVLFFMA